ncbi:ribose 5-phosphate isomerase B [Phototrophicus methaneseepsis]|uniref:Ribose 5-phosphate isomerase B n=1 Tax=Phototrophicus methaneseepsis TaxID=2710758 RepID=A0A7S8ECQ7_9CHLR|nr:ribose 5-phosphate isomerase B [Phototrophicus methaneseepsis]QPC84338.1 ribose 5-phosphate isomerase B [Phototrophicus methaneseepsis]
MKLALSADHAGYQLKQYLITYLQEQGHEVVDLGVDTDAVRSDYPDAAKALGEAVLSGQVERGVLVCGSGVGACVAANKMKGIYAAICHDAYSAGQGVQHDNMNVLCMGARVIGPALAESLVDSFIAAHFLEDGERYVRRFHKIQSMEDHFSGEE